MKSNWKSKQRSLNFSYPSLRPLQCKDQCLFSQLLFSFLLFFSSCIYIFWGKKGCVPERAAFYISRTTSFPKNVPMLFNWSCSRFSCFSSSFFQHRILTCRWRVSRVSVVHLVWMEPTLIRETRHVFLVLSSYSVDSRSCKQFLITLTFVMLFSSFTLSLNVTLLTSSRPKYNAAKQITTDYYCFLLYTRRRF